MDLKINEVAELLNLSEETIKKWLEEEQIPSYRLNGEYRFNPAEIEDWLIQAKFGEAVPIEVQSGNLQFSLFRALYRGHVLQNVPGTTKEEVFQNAMQQIGQELELDAQVLTDLFLSREQMMPTALGHGIAVPHSRDFLLNTHYDVITVVFPETPIDYGALDGNPVDTLFFLFASEDRHHLNLLSKLAHLCANSQARDFFHTQPEKGAFLEFVKVWERSLHHNSK